MLRCCDADADADDVADARLRSFASALRFESPREEPQRAGARASRQRLLREHAMRALLQREPPRECASECPTTQRQPKSQSRELQCDQDREQRSDRVLRAMSQARDGVQVPLPREQLLPLTW